MSNTTAAEAAIMEQAAQKFEGVADGLDQMLTRLFGELEVLQTAFKGRAGSSFEAVKQAYGENQRKLRTALNETATAIRTSGKQYTETDDQAQTKVSGINTTMSLPL